ncbi:uncharacterized protein cobll1a isoform X2 [Salminus brasiliensis]|uniref:uncharacterized protein cobll1a isoform X2 n=1 Tax=Salminus brasiliensis TaxID=930266 RepID=UPI003B82E6D8
MPKTQKPFHPVAAVSDVPKDPTALTQGCEEEKLVIMEKRQREKENKGFLSLFRRSKKTAEEDGSNTNSAPTSPVRNNQHGVSMSCLKADSPTPMPSADMPKKRRAPQPPNNMGSQSFPCGLNSSQSVTLPNDAAGGNQGVLTRVSSSESSLKRTKRRAPPPPCTSPSITDSSDKERSCVRASLNFTSLEEDQEEEAALLYSGDSCFNQYSDFTPCLSTHSSSLMTEILSEFMDVMKAEDQGELSPYSSATYLPPAVNSSPSQQSVHGSPDSNLDSGPIAPPGCQLWRNCSQREGLTTFTVVPRRRQMSSRQYEVLITLEASDSLEQATEKMEGLEYITKHGEETLEWRNGKLENLEAEELGKPEPCRHERVTQEKCNGENLESRDAQLGILELTEKGFNKLKLDTDMEKHLAEEMDGQVPVEEEGEEERDWVEEYRERRRRFQGDDQKPVKFDKWMKGFEEELGYTIEDETKDGENGFPLPPCAVAWEENKSMRGIQEGTVTFKTDKEEDKGPRHYPHHEPLTYHVPDPYWDVNHSSNASLNSDAPEVLLTHSDTPSHPNATVDLPSPAPMSLFALAVARRAQTLQKGVWPSTLSTQSFSSQIQPSLHPSGGFISQNQISQRSSHCFPPAQTLSRQVFGSTSTYTAEKGVRG